MSQDNCYLLLDLDPTEDDWSKIEARIETKRREWSKLQISGPPAKKRQVGAWLERMPDIQRVMRDPETRRAESREARKLVQQQRDAQRKQLDDHIAILTGRGSFTDADIKRLASQPGAPSAGDIERQLSAAGVRKQTAHHEEKLERLESTVEGAIRKNLRHLKLSSLYEFLDLKPRSSPAALSRRAGELHSELMRLGKTDNDASARGELVGLCKRVFSNVADKAKYDLGLSLEVLDEMRPLLETAGGSGFIDQTTLDVLISQAVKRGADAVLAERFIRDHARDRRWGVVHTDTSAKGPARRLCGYCGAHADARAKVCTTCGEPLDEACPRCGASVPTVQSICGSCGSHTGDGPQVRGLLKDGHSLTVNGAWREAREAFERALSLWPNWEPALTGIADLEQRSAALERISRELDALIGKRTFGAARRQLDSARSRFGAHSFKTQEASIEAGIQRAQSRLKQARDAQRRGDVLAALEGFADVLTIQTDSQEARDALDQCPPDAPLDLRIEASGNGFKMRWRGPTGSVWDYAVTRTADAPMSTPDTAAVLAWTSATHYLDAHPPAGRAWYYNVFTRHSGTVSRTTAYVGPVLRPAEVCDLDAVAGDRRVTLSWRRPDGASDVEVVRLASDSPRSGSAGLRLPISGDHCVDDGLSNDRTVRYRLTALFPHPERAGQYLRASGVDIDATPTAPPRAVLDLRAERRDGKLQLNWSMPPVGDVQLFRRAVGTPPPGIGELIDARRASALLGELIPVRARGSATLALHDTVTQITPLTVAGTTAVIGKTIEVTFLDPVTAIRSMVRGRSVVLTWTWPATASQVLLVWRQDAYPGSARDPGAESRLITRAEYQRMGCATIVTTDDRPQFFTLFVAADADGPYSEGTSHLETMGQSHEVRYRLRGGRPRWIGGGKTELELSTDRAIELPPLLLIGRPDSLPTNTHDGRLLQDLSALTLSAGVTRIALNTQDWATNTVVRLFFHNGNDAKFIRLINGGADTLRYQGWTK